MGRKRTEKASLTELFGLPQDAAGGETVLTFVGPRALQIENYRNLLSYSDTEIRVQARKYRLRITGDRLGIRYFDKDEMKVTGRISSVSFEGQDGKEDRDGGA